MLPSQSTVDEHTSFHMNRIIFLLHMQRMIGMYLPQQKKALFYARSADVVPLWEFCNLTAFLVIYNSLLTKLEKDNANRC